ncbi:hypothetical protein COCOBI_10-0570 [Coccomyxa sp. Obi]|nr:hypothetical protein COCOBI_10-0570 [Coccomyxa sp. Obi]
MCKAHISQGKSSSTTKVSKDFVARVGWFASEDKETSGQPNSSGQTAGRCASQRPEHFSCILAVDDCQIETVVETADSATLLESSAPFDKVEGHIHICEKDFKALMRSGWDSQICYLDAVPQVVFSRPTNCPSGCTSFIDALGMGHADCMRYWYGSPIASLASTVGKSREEVLRDRQFDVSHPNCRQAAQWPSAEALMYAHDILGLSWDAHTCAEAAAAGSIACLSYAHCSGCPWESDVCSSAAAAGSMACLVYAHEHGCEWTLNTCAAAAGSGHLDCLVYARTHGCQWDADTCHSAAGSGNLKILAYAYENGCPWDASTCAAAAGAGSLECLVWHAKGSEWKCAFFQGRCDVLEYIHQHGGALCGQEELMGMTGRLYSFLDSEGVLDGKARCLLYMHCFGGRKLPPLRGRIVGERVLALMQQRRAAVLLSFWAAGRARAGSRSSNAAHAAMASVPADLIKEIFCMAKLLTAD